MAPHLSSLGFIPCWQICPECMLWVCLNTHWTSSFSSPSNPSRPPTPLLPLIAPMSSQLLNTLSTYSWSFASVVDTLLNCAKELVFQSSWSPLTRIAESTAVLCIGFLFFSSFLSSSNLLLPVLCCLIHFFARGSWDADHSHPAL